MAVTAVLLTLSLALPVDIALQFVGSQLDRAANVITSAALALALIVARSLGPRSWPLLWLIPLFLLLCVVRLLFYGLVHFSGQGFGEEFFLHLEPESVRIAWHEYGRFARRGLILLTLATVALVWLFGRVGRLSRTAALGGLVAAALSLAVMRQHLPEWQLWAAWQQWRAPVVVGWSDNAANDESSRLLPSDWAQSMRVRRWQEVGLLDPELPTTAEISAVLPDQPKNLLLIYVEALGLSVIEHPDWPGLMPGFKHLLRDHAWVDHLHTSSHVTIEGVANTQCGLLFPFRGGGSGFAGRNIVAENLPCLGDVLAAAGYHQTHVLGGGPMSFTGKGDFLAAHGYNDLFGWEYFRARGFSRHPGHWGISDIETLAEVRRLIEQRRMDDRPFHVSTLTVGSHIPGYSYESCKPYGDGDERYLDALHCADQLIVGWLDEMSEDGLLEDTVVVITGDHPVFANPEMYALFGDRVHDHRLPLIVMGEDLPRPAHAYGAGYDLAPTILDLLRVEHNARFALGRSLARSVDRPDYFVSRGRDVQTGRPVENRPQECRNDHWQDGPPQLPLNRCEKRELLSVLHGLTMAYSGSVATSACAADPALALTVPRGRTGPVQMIVGGQDFSGRFAWRGRASRPSEPGLYVVAMDASGGVQAQTFIPEDALIAQGRTEIPADIAEADWLVAVWRPRQHENFALDAILDGIPEGHSGSGGWLISSAGELVASARETRPAALELTLSVERCKRLISRSNSPASQAAPSSG